MCAHQGGHVEDELGEIQRTDRQPVHPVDEPLDPHLQRRIVLSIGPCPVAQDPRNPVGSPLDNSVEQIDQFVAAPARQVPGLPPEKWSSLK